MSPTEFIIHKPAPSYSPQCLEFANSLNSPPFVAQMLLHLGIKDTEEARDFFMVPLHKTHDGLLLKNMQQAVTLVMQAIQEQKSIVVHGDYDLDGISGTALLYCALSRLGAKVQTYLPSRFEHGYGLNSTTVQQFAQDGVQVLITVDTGISAIEEIALARSKGMQVVVLDHHQPGEQMPQANALLNPHQAGCEYPEKILAGVGVAFKFVQVLYKQMQAGEACEFLDFMVLGTLADMMPLVGENRRYVRNGMKHLAHSVFPGIRALAQDADLRADFLRSQDVSYKVVPLLNAPGRLGSPDAALQLLICHNAQKADVLLQELKANNEERRKIESRIAQQAIDLVKHGSGMQDAPVIILKSAHWHVGVIGIVAAKLVSIFHKPALVFMQDADGVLQGSARGVPGFDWHKALQSVSALLERWGGHPVAAGCSLPVTNYEAFTKGILEYAVQNPFAISQVQVVKPDYFVPIETINAELMTWLHRFEPFGNGNPEPVFYCDAIVINGRCRVVGEEHLQIDVCRNGAIFSSVAFNMGFLCEKLLKQKSGFSISYYPVWNFFKGRRTIQLHISAFGDLQQ
jgi:single-stranded-DNA-specific exonuclease